MDVRERRSTPSGLRTRRPGRYFFLLLASFLLLVIVPVIAFGLVAHRFFSATLINESRGYSRQMLSFLGRELDSDLLGVETELLDLDLMSSFRFLTGDVAKSEPEIIYEARLVQIELARIVGQSSILHSTLIYFPELGRVLTDQTTSVLEAYENADLVRAVVAGTFTEGPMDFYEPASFGGPRRVYVVMRQRPHGSERPRAYILANLDLDSVVTRLEEFRVVPESILSVVTPSWVVIAASGATAGDGGTADDVANNVLFEIPSALRSWTYRTTIPGYYFRSRTRPIRLLVAQLAAILIALGVVVSYALSRRLYSPIRQVLNDIGRESTDRRRNEFAFIDEAVREMADSNRYLSRLLEVHAQSIQNAVFRRLLEGAYIQPGVLRASLSFLGFPDQWIVAAVAIVEEEGMGTERAGSERSFFQRLAIADAAERVAQEVGFAVFPLLLRSNSVHLVMVTNKSDLAEPRSLRAYAVSLQQAILTHLGLMVSIGLGTLEERLHLLSHSAERASRALQAKFVRGRASVYSADDVEEDDEVVYLYPVNEIQKINHHLTGGASDDLRHAIDAMFAELIAHRSLAPSLIKSVAIQLVSATAATLSARGMSMDHFLPRGTSVLEQIDQMQSVGALQTWIGELYSSLAEQIRRQAEEYSAVVRGVIEFVEEHYAEPISLSHIAEHLGMTQQYVSKRFKEEMGVNYVDFLNRYRLDAARDILLQSRDTVRCIGESVGFANPQYFIKRFRERFGLTPAQFRESAGAVRK